MTDQPPEPYRPADQPTQPIQPSATAPHTAEGTGESTAGQVDNAQAAKRGNTKRILQMGAVGVAGLVAGSALTFAVTANGNVTGSNNAGPGSGQLGGPGGRGGGAPGYFEGSRDGRPPGQNGQGNQNGQTDQGGSTDQGTAPSSQPSTQGG